mgnify:CR=1 FL=1
MSSDGVIFVTITVAEGMLLREADIETRGFMESRSEILRLIKRDATDRVQKMLKDNLKERDIELALSKSLKNLVFKLSRRNPLIVVQVLEV